jgi:hypothetical protein
MRSEFFSDLRVCITLLTVERGKFVSFPYPEKKHSPPNNLSHGLDLKCKNQSQGSYIMVPYIEWCTVLYNS